MNCGETGQTGSVFGIPYIEKVECLAFAEIQENVMKPARSLTVAAWVRVEGRSGTILEQEKWASLYLRGGKVRFTLATSETTVEMVESTDPISTGSWVFLAGVYDEDKGKMTLYVNGNPVSEKFVEVSDEVQAIVVGNLRFGASSLTLATPPCDPALSPYPDTSGNSSNGCAEGKFEGGIDDVRIYDRALSQGEIELLNEDRP